MKTRIVQKQFKRIESKYIVDKAVFSLFEKELAPYMVADEYATSTITNIYFDNEQFDMIQDAIAKKNGREKVRMRIYDAKPTTNSQAFLEIKKKSEGIGYKFRLTSTAQAVTSYITKGLADASITDVQVTTELQELRQRYGRIYPKMYIYYERTSFKSKQGPKVRLTVDQNLIYRDSDVVVAKDRYGRPLLDSDKMIMEIKVPGEQPDWLVQLLEKYQIQKQSFSKYGNAYRLSQAESGGDALATRII